MELSELSKDRIRRIANKIKELRIKAGYTSYEHFAIEHDFNRKYYWSVEKGRNLSLGYLFKILEIHKISPSEFFKSID